MNPFDGNLSLIELSIQVWSALSLIVNKILGKSLVITSQREQNDCDKKSDFELEDQSNSELFAKNVILLNK